MANSVNPVTNTGSARQSLDPPSTEHIIIGSIQGGISIIGIPTIDKLIIDACPSILTMSDKHIHALSRDIKGHIFGDHFINSIIEHKTNAEVAQIIEGLAIIASINDICSIEGIAEYIESFGADNKASEICRI